MQRECPPDCTGMWLSLSDGTNDWRYSAIRKTLDGSDGGLKRLVVKTELGKRKGLDLVRAAKETARGMAVKETEGRKKGLGGPGGKITAKLGVVPPLSVIKYGHHEFSRDA